MRNFSKLCVLLSCLALTACPEQPPVVDDGGSDAGCVGEVGCACNPDSTCAAGECVGGTCTDCRRGSDACVCRANGTCDTGLRCEGATCRSCPAGQEGCGCGAGGSCGTGLICSNNVCVLDTCVAGGNNCPCRDADPKCDGSNTYCDGTNRCQACSSDVVGCACDTNSMCQGNTVCDATSTTCRAPITCANLIANGGCAANQRCTQAGGADAVCVAMTCEDGYRWNGSGCTACSSPDCSAEPRCDDVDGGLGSTCAAQNRECNTVGQVASCGNCLRGFAANPQGVCRPVPSCGATTCPLTQYCDRQGTPTCRDLPCDGGVLNASNQCTTCPAQPNCSFTGYSGRVWPVLGQGGVCICETLDEYYLPPGGNARPELCDADHDGWVRSDAVTPAIVNNPALSDNARCQVLSAERVQLIDEYGIAVDVLSCNEGMLKASYPAQDGGWPNGGVHLFADGGVVPGPDGGVACSSVVAMKLLETKRNDVPDAPPDNVDDMPSYGPTDGGGTRREGRMLVAAELNALTKACVGPNADFNDDNEIDISETQAKVTSTSTEQERLASFSYFVELHEAWWQSNGAPTGNLGVLVIRERSRCDVSFPLRYSTSQVAPPNWTDGYVVATPSSGASPYWRNCARNRDTAFRDGARVPNTDFGAWSCDDNGGFLGGAPNPTDGTCANLTPPAHQTLIAPVDGNTVNLRNFGLCELDGNLPADRRWRGMQHHSQFKCMQATAANVGDFSPNTDNKMTFNECVARPCTSPTDPSCRNALGNGLQTRQPVIECVPTANIDLPTVGFAAVNFQRGTAYTRGCTDETTLATSDGKSWESFICPTPAYATAAAGEFGRFGCFGTGRAFLWAPTGLSLYTFMWAEADGGSTTGARLGPTLP